MQHPVVAAPVNTKASQVTILTAFAQKTVKSYNIDQDGALLCVPYGQESHFTCQTLPVSNIFELGELVQNLSQTDNTILIRGAPTPGLKSPTRRLSELFPESEGSCQWIMLDFDNLSVPSGVNPLSIEAIESAIRKLPAEFHSATYFYQFSASAGILRPDGTPLKTGLNVHLFFFLEQPVQGRKVAAYLTLHAIETGFYEKTTNRTGLPVIKLGFDPAVLRSSVQPHYVGFPSIGDGVGSKLAAEQRQGLVKKQHNHVGMSALSEDVVRAAGIERKRLLDQHKREKGYVASISVSRASDGAIAATSYFKRLDVGHANASKKFLAARPYNEDALILFFEGESSPGSWFVRKTSPTVARKFGEGEQVPLKELSPGAFAYIRDEMKWFSEISSTDTLQLSPEGFLPDFQSFASAKNSLIIAPTGSGKTSAFARFASANSGAVIFYTAQTIALVDQMYADLEMRSIPVNHYQAFYPSDDLGPGVYVTTNESLKKFVLRAVALGRNYTLVIDEAHAALDDFMSSTERNRGLNTALGRAERALLLTATLTPLQVAKWSELISAAYGELRPEIFEVYKFMPTKRRPLVLKPLQQFGADFAALLRHYQELVREGLRLPRTIIIAPTGKMRIFEVLLEQFGLSDFAEVVSRPESTQSDIGRAQTSTKPLLISSPLFSLGLNFEVQPERFWTHFATLPVDTSQIIQTLNRANRGSVSCEVRLYQGKLDHAPIWLPKRLIEAARIRGILESEASVQGALDAHLHIDRTTYNSLRLAEKCTSKALATLIDGDSIENYTIDREWVETLNVTEADAQVYKEARVAAQAYYSGEVSARASSLAAEPDAQLYARLHRLTELRRLPNPSADGVERKLEFQEQGALAALCKLSDPTQSKRIKTTKVLRLHSELPPYLTSQFNTVLASERSKATAEKVKTLRPLLQALSKLKKGEIDGLEFAHAMRRNLRGSVLALVDSEADLIQRWHPKLERLDKLAHESKAQASQSRRASIRKEQFAIAADFLESIGVFFDKKGSSSELDLSRPKVPDWDFERLLLKLDLSVRSFEKVQQVTTETDWQDLPICRSVCDGCVHKAENWICRIGRPIHWPDLELSGASQNCDARVNLPKVLMAKMEALLT